MVEHHQSSIGNSQIPLPQWVSLSHPDLEEHPDTSMVTNDMLCSIAEARSEVIRDSEDWV